jgi:hypothetical protein
VRVLEANKFMKEALIYVRVSSKEQKQESHSIPVQKKLLAEYAIYFFMHIKNVSNWINDLADEKPVEFGEFFYDDIRNYLNFSECTDDELENCLKEVCGAKYDNFISCQNKEETKKWLDKISGNIIMELDTENIIHKYFN